MSGCSGAPLAKKLGIKSGARVFLHAAPSNYAQLVAPLPPDVHTVPRIDGGTDLIHVFSSRRSELARLLQRARRAMRPDATLWVSWPKQASGVPSEVTEDVVRELALPLGLVDIKVCAVDEIWSGLKLVVRKVERAAVAAPGRPRP